MTEENTQTNTTAEEKKTTAENTKQLKHYLACELISQLDSTLAGHLESNSKLGKVYTAWTEFGLFMNKFKDENPITLKKNAGDNEQELEVYFTINEGMRYKQVIADVLEKYTTKALSDKLDTLVEGTHMKAFYANTDEREKVLDDTLKVAHGLIKKSFKSWIEFLDLYYQAQFNLSVEASDVDSELRINGIYELGVNKEKTNEFYVNPTFIADSVGKDLKSYQTSTKKAAKITEDMECLKNPEILSQVATLLKGTLDLMPSTLSTTKDLLKTCSSYRLEAKVAPESGPEVASVDDTLNTETVEEI